MISYLRVYTLCLGAFVMAAVFLLCGMFVAHASDPVFTISGVKVDVTDKDAATAREHAFVQAQQDAFKQLAEKLLTDADASRLKIPDGDTISAFINDYEITEEHISDVRYVGTYTFRFRGDAVRNWLSGQGLSYSDVGSKPVLVLPLYQQGVSTALWGNDNPWLAAWMQSTSLQGLVPVVVPIGDAEDVADISGKDALTYDPQALQEMTSRYGAARVIILMATPVWPQGETSASAPQEVDIAIYRAENAPAYVTTLKVTALAGDDASALYARAVQDTRQMLQSAWKSQTVASATDANSLKVRVRFNTMQEWVETQDALHRVQGVSDVRLLSLQPKTANVELVFHGSEDLLRTALSQADMTLSLPQVSVPALQQASDVTGSAPALVYDLYLSKYAPAAAPAGY